MRRTMLQWNKRCVFIISVLFCTLFVLTACYSKNVSNTEANLLYEKNFELTGGEKDDVITTIHPTVYELANRVIVEEGKQPIVFSSIPQEGLSIDVPAGRYHVTSESAGVLYVYDENKQIIYKESIGAYVGKSFHLDVTPNMNIIADGGFDSIQFQPVVTNSDTRVLTTGVWHVGVDIPVGRYEMRTEQGYGYVYVLEKGKEPRLYEVIGDEQYPTLSELDLKAGQVIYVTKLYYVELTKMTNET